MASRESLLRPAYKVQELLALRDSVSESAVSLDKFGDEDAIKGVWCTGLRQKVLHLNIFNSQISQSRLQLGDKMYSPTPRHNTQSSSNSSHALSSYIFYDLNLSMSLTPLHLLTTLNSPLFSAHHPQLPTLYIFISLIRLLRCIIPLMS